MKYCFPALVRAIFEGTPRFLLLSVLLAAAAAPSSWAQPLPDSKLISSDPLDREDFGAVLALDGNVAVIGDRRDSDDFTGVGEYGAAFVFRYDGVEWVQESKLTAPERGFYHWFGRSVAVHGERVLVGTLTDVDIPLGAGAIYVYRYDGANWTEETRLTAPDGSQAENFGYSLAIENDVILVGSPRRNEIGALEGAAYVYRYDGSGWVNEAKLTASDMATSANFGISVSLSGTRALIGASGDRPPGGGQNSGAAYVFEYDGSQWLESAKLAATPPVGQAQFGLPVSLDGDRALIGARLDNELGGGAGAAYIFRLIGDEWIEEAKLLASDNSGFNLFGSSVALDGTTALVGSENWAPVGQDATGKAYVFAFDDAEQEWKEVAGLVPSDGGTGDNFGAAVALDGGVMIVGSPNHHETAAGGAAYVYGRASATTADDTPPSASFELSAAYPNPFSDRAHFNLTLERHEHARIAVFDVLGREIRVLHDGVLPPHVPHAFNVSGGGLPGGLYVIRTSTPTSARNRMVVLQR